MKQQICWLSILGALVATLPASAQVSFAPPVTYKLVGDNAVAFTVADVNGDGKIDLVCSTLGDDLMNGTISIFTNDGRGGFNLASTANPGGAPSSIAAADINGDGMVDLITANFNNGNGNTLSVLTNNGHGTFGINAMLNAGSAPYAVITADINGDGKLALICANYNPFLPPGLANSTLSVFTNDGSGVFGSNATINVPDDPTALVAADVNGDSKLDLICGGTTNFLTVLTNDGRGGFGFNVRLTAGPDTYIGRSQNFLVLVGDVTGDHKPDLLSVSSYGNTLTILTNNGFGGFGSNTTVNIGGVPFWGAVADVNGDGRPDLLCANSFPTSVTVLTNNGLGGFVLASTLSAGSLPRMVTMVDVNGDGKPDVIYQDLEDNTISVYTNKTIFLPPASTPTPALKHSGQITSVSWPSASAGWSLQQSHDLTPAHWGPAGFNGFNISDDGTNNSLTVQAQPGNGFFRLVHP
ncbi:MAG TPA: VCBS repeat-containing protein [Candidatus Acidoferrales bacterium]|jgi:hypothetical protein|nr:VCBS repeat-containing protein [Candidatus Acidoferrales bacterium]